MAAIASRNVILGEAPARTTVDRLCAKHDGLDPPLVQGIEAIVWSRRPQIRRRYAACFESRWLAVDEHVVGLVRDADNRRGLRVADAGRGDTAHRVEAQHLDDIPQ
jgi:hypothetical protein